MTQTPQQQEHQQNSLKQRVMSTCTESMALCYGITILTPHPHLLLITMKREVAWQIDEHCVTHTSKDYEIQIA